MLVVYGTNGRRPKDEPERNKWTKYVLVEVVGRYRPNLTNVESNRSFGTVDGAYLEDD